MRNECDIRRTFIHRDGEFHALLSHWKDKCESDSLDNLPGGHYMSLSHRDTLTFIR